MGIYRQFPYTNFHDLNLDWLLENMRGLLTEWAEYQEKWNVLYNDITTAFDDFKAVFDEHIAQYDAEFRSFINSIDVNKELRTVFDQAVADGTVASIINPVIATKTAEWLALNITEPQGVVIDKSLTVDGACADAKVVGDKFKKVDTNLKIFNIFDLLDNATFTDNTVNGITYEWNGRNVRITGTASPASFNNLIVSQNELPNGFIAGHDIYCQWFNNQTYLNFLWYENGTLLENKYVRGAQALRIPANANGVIVRVYVVSGTSVNATITPVIETIGENNLLKYYGAIAETPFTVNTAPNQSILLLSGNEPNVPVSTSAWLITIGGTLGFQIWIAAGNGRIYYRYRNPNFEYSEWEDQYLNSAILSKSIRFGSSYTGDLNEAPINQIVIDTGNCENSPVPDYAGYVFTTGAYDSSHIQIWIQYGNGTMYYRRGLGGTWYNWLPMSGGGDGNNPYAKMYSICNSILTGAVYVNGVLDHLCQYGNAPYSCVADAIGIKQDNVTHVLHSSTGILYDAGQGSFKDTITNTDISNYDCVLTHFWLADMENYDIGSLSSTANDGTLAGAILSILNHMRSSNGKARLLLASVPPSSYTIYGNNVFTGRYANGSSIAELDTLMHQLAEREHFTYVDFQNWNVSYYYQNYTDGQNVHLNDDAGYRSLGGYIGGKFSNDINF